MVRDDVEQNSRMKLNTGSAMNPNSFGPIPEPVFSFAGIDFHRHVAALDNTMAGSLPLERED